MADGILQSVVQPIITGAFTVLAAWITTRFPKNPLAEPSRSDVPSINSDPRSDSVLPADKSQPRAKRLTGVIAILEICLALIALMAAILALLAVPRITRSSAAYFAIAAAVSAFLCGAINSLFMTKGSTSTNESSGNGERKSMNEQNRAFVWITAPIAGVALGVALAAIGFNVNTVGAEGGSIPIKAPFVVNGYYIPSGFMGDYTHLTLNAQSKENCQVGPTCMKFEYKPRSLPSNPDWVGVYWQSPEHNFGEQPGRKLEGVTKLIFQARGAEGGELVSFKVGGIHGKKYEDSLEVAMDPSPVKLTSHWQQYEIDLRKQDTSSVIGIFELSLTREGNPQGATFFLDGVQIN